MGNYYVPQGDVISCKGKPFFINGSDHGLTTFQNASQAVPIKQGSDTLIGRVWASSGHEWCPNVQKLPGNKYTRKQLAIDNDIGACLGVVHSEGGSFKGVIEFYKFKKSA